MQQSQDGHWECSECGEINPNNIDRCINIDCFTPKPNPLQTNRSVIENNLISHDGRNQKTQLAEEVLELDYTKEALKRSQDKMIPYQTFITDDLSIVQLNDLKTIHDSLVNDMFTDPLNIEQTLQLKKGTTLYSATH